MPENTEEHTVICAACRAEVGFRHGAFFHNPGSFLSTICRSVQCTHKNCRVVVSRDRVRHVTQATGAVLQGLENLRRVS